MPDAQVLNENFNPKKRGRPTLISVDGLLDMADENKGLWVQQTFDNQSSRLAVSAARQLKKAGLEVSTRSTPEGRAVYFRKI